MTRLPQEGDGSGPDGAVSGGLHIHPVVKITLDVNTLDAFSASKQEDIGQLFVEILKELIEAASLQDLRLKLDDHFWIKVALEAV
ncbi:hypothetical protein [Bradyrhizobium elkanii]|uniref:hypothetical protein n=1 Tax=Bradyrhizobium elkanii TaxID=29448 RepID=UPI003513E71F